MRADTLIFLLGFAALLGFLRGGERKKESPKLKWTIDPEVLRCKIYRVTASDNSRWLILHGRDGEENDRLSLKVGQPWETWLHASNIPGAHVVIRSALQGWARRRPDSFVLELAARVAAFNSQGAGSKAVKVHATTCDHVSKHENSKPGEVIIRLDNVVELQVQPITPAEMKQYDRRVKSEEDFIPDREAGAARKQSSQGLSKGFLKSPNGQLSDEEQREANDRRPGRSDQQTSGGYESKEDFKAAVYSKMKEYEDQRTKGSGSGKKSKGRSRKRR
eukprot:gnl/TRDRNA2_/TRDRNA2_178008_c1_seq16.p1 gnl/TRDRNA2_/TRDRNA2_178008_c1~~gnl/TRDRNA2_/TRDRNA2_178008_c1_seq16.p1  ORF type:complete len:276 (+),score=53.60 gnl/TRDRNA2_/TRDRNA2_178008_c1_seq16:89-916(+)